MHTIMSTAAVQTETHSVMAKDTTVDSSDMEELMRKVKVSKRLIIIVL